MERIEEGISLLSEEEARALFRNNLKENIDNRKALDYIVDMLCGLMKPKDSIMPAQDQSEPLPVVFENLWRKKDKHSSYNSFRDYGDSFLLLCGYFPDHVAGKRKSPLRIDDYMRRGEQSYGNAAYIARKHSLTNDPGMLDTLSRDFRKCSRALFEMRMRVDNVAFATSLTNDQQVLREITSALYGMKDVEGYLLSIAGSERPPLRLVKDE
ncbi:MAG: hypothetical protein R6U32_03465 [Candidatus Woesearchaeota archaeon]